MAPWFSKLLIKWYLANKRDLPWRHETDPYKIWLSEIILQQTQVAQGLHYYLRFTEKYPRVGDLAAAPEDEVLKQWQGLGYYSRARNLHSTAKEIVLKHGGAFPKNYADIRSLKGIGDYTAAAITSFAWGLPHAVVDGNVYRLLARLFGLETPIDSVGGKKEFQQLADVLLDCKQAALHNQAVMEFGALYCRPKNPDCANCIFATRCLAYAAGKVHVLPVKAKKTKVRDRYFNYLVLIDKKGRVLLRRREERDIWQGLYEFPLIESDNSLHTQELLKLPHFSSLAGSGGIIVKHSDPYIHLLSHQRLHARFIVVRVKKVWSPKLLAVSSEQLHNYAFPRLIEKFINDCGLTDLF